MAIHQTSRGFPYPDGNEAYDPALHIENLAKAVDDDLNGASPHGLVVLQTAEDAAEVTAPNNNGRARRKTFLITPTKTGIARVDYYYRWWATNNAAGNDDLVVPLPGAPTWSVFRHNDGATHKFPVSLHAEFPVEAGVEVNIGFFASAQAGGVTRHFSDFRVNMWIR